MSRDLGDLLEQTARGPCDAVFDPAEIAVRARRSQRWQAVGAVAAVMVLAASGVWGLRLTDGPDAPFIEPGPTAGQVPAGWQTITVGAAQLSVPGDWPVIDLADDPTAYCTRFLNTATLLVGPAPQPPPTCPSPPEAERAVGVHAVGFSLLGGAFDGDPVEINGQRGVLTDDDGQVRSYVFPELGLMLEVGYQPNPELADRVLSTLRPADDDAVEPTPAQPSAAATSLDAGPVLSAGSLLAMTAEGIALQSSAGVVFVGLDGTVHGHLPGAVLDRGGPGQRVPGPVPVLLQAAPDRQPEDTALWVQPSTGATTPLHSSTPLPPGYQIIEAPGEGDPAPLELAGPDGEQLAEFSANVQWNVSAGHRVVSWHDCPADVADLSGCTAEAYDTDSGRRVQLDTGCWVSDAFADLNHSVVCWQPWNDDAWIERRGPGQDAIRIPLPRYRDQPDSIDAIGHYRNAFLAGEHVVATWSAECEIPVPVVTDGNGPPRPLMGDTLADGPAAHVLGVTPDRQVVVHVLDSPECGQPGPAGIHLVDPDTGTTTPVISAHGIEDAMMWTPQPHLADRDQIAAQGDVWVTRTERVTWEREHGSAHWVVGYFYPSDPPAVDGVIDFVGLEARWKRVATDDRPLDPDEELRRAYAQLGASRPEGLESPLRGAELALRRATLDGDRLTLDFRPAAWTTAAVGTTGESMMFNQLAAVAAHYFADAEELCILVDGDEGPLFSHGLSPCPHQLP